MNQVDLFLMGEKEYVYFLPWYISLHAILTYSLYMSAEITTHASLEPWYSEALLSKLTESFSKYPVEEGHVIHVSSEKISGGFKLPIDWILINLILPFWNFLRNFEIDLMKTLKDRDQKLISTKCQILRLRY